MAELQLPPLSLYVHIPWCVQKCPYCDFNSHQLKDGIPERAYIEALLQDLEQELVHLQGRTIQTMFIGGGTPSLLSVKAMKQLIEGVKARLAISPGAEITMEANPGTVEASKFEGFTEAGVNRISIGVQSLQAQQLNLLGRIHDPQQAIQAVLLAKSLPLKSFNLDLMHGLPKQSLAGGLADLEQAIELQPPHLSWYQLTMEPNTPFYRQQPELPDEEILTDIFEQGHQLLVDAGYQRYEISGYSLPGYECRHNLNYWSFGDYLGIGCGAHGKITLPAQKRIIRTAKVSSPNAYLAPSREYLQTQHEVAPEDLPFEYFMNRARLTRAAPLAEFEQRTGLPLRQVEGYLQQQAQAGLIRWGEKEWQITERGMRYFNNLLEPLVVG